MEDGYDSQLLWKGERIIFEEKMKIQRKGGGFPYLHIVERCQPILELFTGI